MTGRTPCRSLNLVQTFAGKSWINPIVPVEPTKDFNYIYCTSCIARQNRLMRSHHSGSKHTGSQVYRLINYITDASGTFI